MGQYYMVYAKKQYYESPDVWDVTKIGNGGYKLMEHSWLDDAGVNTIMRQLHEQGPYNIIWMGDYADADEKLNEVQKEGEDLYSIVWCSKNEYYDHLGCNPLNVKEGQFYLVNHTNEEYLDINKYISMNEKDSWCVHPLPLLTALGNGQGGGDYYGINEDAVGRWANGLIEVTTSKPEGYSELVVEFTED